VAVDLLNRTLFETRSYEVVPGETDRVFQRCLDMVCEVIENGEDASDALKESARLLKRVQVDKSVGKPLVGIVGEIYVRHNSAANNSLIRRLEALGVEVDLATITEWIYYTNYTRRRAAFVEKNFSDLFMTSTRDAVQHFDERRLGKPFRRLVRHTIEQPVRMLLDLASPYIHDSFEGEAVLTVAKAIELFKEHAAGIVNVMPFTCMPGTISGTILKKVHDDLGLCPLMNITYDGLEDATFETRLEAFVHQVRQYHEANVARGAPARKNGMLSAR